MNIKEHDILVDIKNELSKTHQEIASNRSAFNDLRVDIMGHITETKTNIKNLSEKINDIDERMETWTTDGCPVGNVRYANLEKCADEVKAEISSIREKVSNTRKATMWSSAGITAVINAVLAFLTKLHT